MLVRTEKLGGKMRDLFLVCSLGFSQYTKNKKKKNKVNLPGKS